VLPVHAEAFGISLIWVGILLSANRFIRVFAYGYVAQATQAFGTRRMCIVAAVASVVSTAMYGLADGPYLLLLSRMLWGLAYAVLVLVTLAYAVENRAQAGTRVGWSRSIQRAGPIFVLIAGTWATGIIGPRSIFVWTALLTVPALFLASTLPRDIPTTKPNPRPPMLGKPRAIDGMFFVQGLGVDGVFALSITLVLAQEYSTATAVFSGGLLLAMRHIGEAVAAPLFGRLGDKHGAARVFAMSTSLTVLGFAAVAVGYTVAGALLMLIFRGALASLGPATIVQATSAEDSVIAPLARMQAWRDLGAAIGPLMTGAALGVVSPQLLHGFVGVLLIASMAWWYLSRR
jgi:MFS transporter, DHA1 family, inner membrane transport protein